MAETTEARLRTIVSHVLNVTEDRIRSGIDLAALGADSLDLVEIVMKVEAEFGIEVLDSELGYSSTLGEMVRIVEAARAPVNVGTRAETGPVGAADRDLTDLLGLYVREVGIAAGELGKATASAARSGFVGAVEAENVAAILRGTAAKISDAAAAARARMGGERRQQDDAQRHPSHGCSSGDVRLAGDLPRLHGRGPRGHRGDPCRWLRARRYRGAGV